MRHHIMPKPARPTAEMSFARNGKSRLRRWLSARRPWNRPQSRRIDFPPAETRCIDPVTVRAAPQKVTVGSAVGRAGLGMSACRKRNKPRDQPGLVEVEVRGVEPLTS